MPDYKGIEYLRAKLSQKRERVRLRYKYYEMKNVGKFYNSIIPDNFKPLTSTLGWCGKAVDSISDRVIFHEFGNDNFDFNNIYQMNNADVLFDSAILSALISSCCFIYISKGEDGFPRLQVIDGANATGVIDDVTGLLREGYAVLDRDEYGLPTLEAHFKVGETVFYPRNEKEYSVSNKAPYPLLVPIIHRPDAVRPFGHSRISRSCMDIMEAARRTLLRSEVAAEFYSFPQKYVTGLDPDAEQLDKWKATMSSFLQFDKDEDGNKPTLGQFTTASMTPFVEQLKMLASVFAGETGLIIDDLGFSTDNPSSAEAIRASHVNLNNTARKAQRTFGTGFLNAGYLAACVRDDFSYRRNQIYLTKARWEPIFEPDMSALSLIGDGAIKLNQAIPGYLTKENLRDLTGIESDEGGLDIDSYIASEGE